VIKIFYFKTGNDFVAFREDDPLAEHINAYLDNEINVGQRTDESIEVLELPDEEDWRSEWTSIEKIAAGVREEPAVCPDGWEDECKIHARYVGSMINPSGKYYAPFAASNVSCDCPACGGSGDVLNPRRYTQAMPVTDDVVDRLDTMACTLYKANANGHVLEADRKRVTSAASAVRELHNSFVYYLTCPACGGYGSVSAAQDERWQEFMEKFLNEENLWMEQGLNGDPCDYFICARVNDDSED
jgi:hypothetical protein